MNRHKLLSLAFTCYKDLVKPATIYCMTLELYYGGYSNAVQDGLFGKKSVDYHILSIIKNSAVGFLVGVTFPVAVPIKSAFMLYDIYENNKSLDSINK